MLRILQCAVKQRFRIALNRRKRCSQLMRNIDDEVLSNALQPVKFLVLPIQLVNHMPQMFTRPVELF